MKVRAEDYFATVPEWLLYADISASAVRLYATLARHANRNGHAHPSRKTLAKLMRCSPASVDRAMAELVGIDAVTVSERFDRETGRRTSNTVWIRTSNPRNPVELPLTTGDEGGIGAGDEAPLLTGDEQNQSQKEPGVEVVPTASASVLPTSAARASDPIFEVLFELDAGLAYTPETRQTLTKTSADALNVAASEIRRTGIVADELRAAIAAWPSVMGDATCTANAVKKHLPRLRAAANGLVARRDRSEMDDALREVERRRVAG